jgi:phosphatidylserine/phosphatidylglycerophosphate/cardiolipin synthase-like enzyme
VRTSRQMRNSAAFANNDVITIAWSYGKRPDACMGFALYRIDAKGKETVLPSHAVFPGEEIKPGQTTAQFPVQKFYWKDPFARPVAEQTKSFTFRYKIVPLEGAPGSLKPMAALPILTTNEVTLTSRCSPSLAATFNRGLISTQHVSKALKGDLNKHHFLELIGTEGNQLRSDLSGDMIETLTGFLGRTARGGSIYAALYELTDAQLVRSLVALGTKLNIVLADIINKQKKNSGEPAVKNHPAAAKAIGPKTTGAAARKKTAQAAITPVEHDDGPAEENLEAHNALSSSTPDEVFYRLPPSSHIVHNKFLIYVDANDMPQAILTGSTNWTATGLCAQTNNALIVEDPQVAQRYMDYWNALKADQVAHQQTPKSFQAAPLRSFNSKSKVFQLDTKVPKGSDASPSTLTSYFSPNTPHSRSKGKSANEVEPTDMKDLEDRVLAAKHAVLFLAFIPGTPSITNFAAEAQRNNKDLFVRGCVTAPDAAGVFYYTLRGSSPPKRQPTVPGQPKPKKAPVPQDPRVIAADALSGSDVPDGWQAELLKAGFAITHDKIVVIDPFSDGCVVVTGSHNLGYQASYNNDENLLMIEGNRKLAMAYATHVLDVYDHFAWRWTVRQADKIDAHLKTTPDDWLNWYFDAQGNIKTAQLKFWMQATIE